jgi:hypothetical protein
MELSKFGRLKEEESSKTGIQNSEKNAAGLASLPWV